LLKVADVSKEGIKRSGAIKQKNFSIYSSIPHLTQSSSNPRIYRL